MVKKEAAAPLFCLEGGKFNVSILRRENVTYFLSGFVRIGG